MILPKYKMNWQDMLNTITDHPKMKIDTMRFQNYYYMSPDEAQQARDAQVS